MTFGQVDPARLQGEALRRWYLRSPAEIEDERGRADARAYSVFFSRAGGSLKASAKPAPYDDADAAPNLESAQRATGDYRWHDERLPADQRLSPMSGPSVGGGYQVAATAPPGFWEHWGVPGCANCHGYTPETLPPFGGHFPFPPGVSPRSGSSGGSGGSTPSEPRRDGRGQCEMQDRNDRGICVQQPTERAKAVCHETATERRAYCDRTGLIGEPNLYTARRKSGRRWP